MIMCLLPLQLVGFQLEQRGLFVGMNMYIHTVCICVWDHYQCI